MMLRMADETPTAIEPHAIDAAATVEALCEMFEQLQVRQLPVIDRARRVVGVASDHDVAHACCQSSQNAGPTAGRRVADMRVDEIMSRQVVTVEPFVSPEAALRAMVANGFHAVPVVDDGELIGMIRSTDFLREFSCGDWGGYDEFVMHHMRELGQTVEGDQPLSHAFETAEAFDQPFVVVVRGGRPLGVLSRTALRETLCNVEEDDCAAGPQLSDMAIERLLAPLSPLTAQTQLGQAASKMLQSRARALPVVDRLRSSIGLITEDDILRVMVERIEE